MATVTDQIIDLHDRIIGKLFNAAKNKRQQQFQASGKAINDKVRLYGRVGQALLEAKKNGTDPFAAIESVLSWDAFTTSVGEAQKLAQPAQFDFLHRIGENYVTLRRYAPEFLAVLKLRAVPAVKGVLDAIDVLRGMNADNARKVPAGAPTAFVKPRWAKLVLTDEGIDRRYYELCALSELKNALRSGDVWVQGSRQLKDFEDYLVRSGRCAAMKLASQLPLAVATDCDQYLQSRLSLLEGQLALVNRLAAVNELPDISITSGAGLKITPLDVAVPDAAQALIDQTAALLPHVKITELLMEVDEWTGFTRHFTHLKTGDTAQDKALLLTTVLADGIDLGLSKMAESCPGTAYASCRGCRPGTSGTKRIHRLWVNSSTHSCARRLPGTGAMAPRPRPMARTLELAARRRAPDISTQNTEAARDELSTPILRPVRALQRQGGQRRRARLHLCA